VKHRTQWVKTENGKTHKHGGTRRSEDPKPHKIKSQNNSAVFATLSIRTRFKGSKKMRLTERWSGRDRFGIARAMGQI
jgi:hypothetical protein